MSTVVSSPPTGPIWNQQQPPSSPRKGGILLKQLPDDSTSPPTSPANKSINLPRRSFDADAAGRPPFAAPPPTEAGPSVSTGQQIKIAEPAERTGGRSVTKARPASIKFAPLPDPRQHQRSLSTGRNVKLAATLGPGGERTEELQTHGGLSTADTSLRRRDSNDSGLLDGVGDDDNDAENGNGRGSNGDGSDDENAGGQKRLSSMLGTSWSKSTKKLFGGKSSSSSASKRLDRTSSIESNTSGQGAASDLLSTLTRTLSPSVSRSSNGSDVAADKQARLLASLSPDSSSSAGGAASGSSAIGMAINGRRRMSGGSMEVPLSSSWGPNSSALSSSPASRSLVGARMLNGRAYGVKGGVEAIRKAEEDALRGPEFSEWGSVGSMGNNSRPGDEDSDDGTGISWVKKRREAREKAAAERAAAEAAAAADDPALLLSPPSDSGSSLAAPSVSSDGRQSSPLTPKTPSSELPSSYDSVAVSESDLDGEMARQQELAAERKSRALSHDVQAFTLPGHMHSHHHHGHSRTPDDDGLRTPTAGTHSTVNPMSISSGAGASRGVVIDSSDDEDDLDLSDSDDDDDERRNDDDDDESSSGEDDDDRAAMDEARKTAVCAGVEVVSRHKD